MKLHDLQQGSDAWHAFRLEHFGASEAAAMLGLSTRVKRNELLHAKHTGVAREFSDWVQEHLLDRGHELEARARPHVEAMIGDELYPVTCSNGRCSASCDGLTLGQEVVFEHKMWNEALAEYVREFGAPPEEHLPQCQQELMVTGAQRLIFVVSDGTPEKMVYAWVEPDPAWFARLRVGWGQFERDLAEYVPHAAAPSVTAAPQEQLPAVSVQLSGSLAVVTNLAPFGVALRAFVARIPTKPSTDQEFADTEAACKRLKEVEERLAAAEDSALASMSDVETMRRTVADLRELARATRLASEKVVKQRKEQIREEEVRRGAMALQKHRASLNERLGQPFMPVLQSDFGGAIKGLKTLDSVRNAIDTELARCKIAANEIADRIQANMKVLVAAGDAVAFPDAATLVLKAPDDLRAVVAQRVAEAQRRIEAERERIRAEEQAKAQREAAARAAQEAEKQRLAQVEAAPPIQQVPAAAPTVVPIQRAAAPAARQAPVNEPATLKLGAICERLGFTVTAAFVSDTLGIQPAATDKAAKLYRESDWPRICAALVEHINSVSALQAA